MKKRWYEELFENYAGRYDNEPFVAGTMGEVDFIESEMEYVKSKRVLDIGCGTGRHDIELAKRGYRVTGIDLSETQLLKGKTKAGEIGVEVRFILGDARALNFHEEFDLAMMICEGAFPLMETDEMNFSILKGAAAALKPGGKLILTTLNALFPLYHSVKEFLDKSGSDGLTAGNSFDLLTFRERSTLSVTDDLGTEKSLQCDERYYTPSELTWQLKSLGFGNIGIYGCRLGAFSRSVPLTTDDFEMLVVAEKHKSVDA